MAHATVVCTIVTTACDFQGQTSNVGSWLDTASQAVSAADPQCWMASFTLRFVQAFVGRSLSLLRPWGLFMTSCRIAAAKNSGKRGRRRAVLIGTYRWVLHINFFCLGFQPTGVACFPATQYRL